jgi:hypothetical protein
MKFIEKLNNLPELERKNIIISSIFTISLHLIVIILLSSFSNENNESNKKPNFIKAKILIKGEKDGTNSYNAKTDKIRTKEKKFLPDKITKKEVRAQNIEPLSKKITKKEVRDQNIEPIPKKETKEVRAQNIEPIPKKVEKEEKELTEAERSRMLLSSLKKINPALPDDKKGDKNGDLGKRKGGKDGVEDGNESDPTKVLAGSLYERRVASKIKSKWKSPILNDAAKNNLLYTIRIFIDSNGDFTYKTLKKSGNIFFDDSVSNVLKSITKVEAPAPNFQKYYKEKGIVINFFPKI